MNNTTKANNLSSLQSHHCSNAQQQLSVIELVKQAGWTRGAGVSRKTKIMLFICVGPVMEGESAQGVP